MENACWWVRLAIRQPVYSDRLGQYIAFSQREGIALSTITYNDDGVLRPLFYRLSLAEMVVPYGPPEHPHPRKFAFDVLVSRILRAKVVCLPKVSIAASTAWAHKRTSFCSVVTALVRFTTLYGAILLWPLDAPSDNSHSQAHILAMMVLRSFSITSYASMKRTLVCYGSTPTTVLVDVLIVSAAVAW